MTTRRLTPEQERQRQLQQNLNPGIVVDDFNDPDPIASAANTGVPLNKTILDTGAGTTADQIVGGQIAPPPGVDPASLVMPVGAGGTLSPLQQQALSTLGVGAEEITGDPNAPLATTEAAPAPTDPAFALANTGLEGANVFQFAPEVADLVGVEDFSFDLLGPGFQKLLGQLDDPGILDATAPLFGQALQEALQAGNQDFLADTGFSGLNQLLQQQAVGGLGDEAAQAGRIERGLGGLEQQVGASQGLTGGANLADTLGQVQAAAQQQLEQDPTGLGQLQALLGQQAAQAGAAFENTFDQRAAALLEGPLSAVDQDFDEAEENFINRMAVLGKIDSPETRFELERLARDRAQAKASIRSQFATQAAQQDFAGRQLRGQQLGEAVANALGVGGFGEQAQQRRFENLRGGISDILGVSGAFEGAEQRDIANLGGLTESALGAGRFFEGIDQQQLENLRSALGPALEQAGFSADQQQQLVANLTGLTGQAGQLAQAEEALQAGRGQRVADLGFREADRAFRDLGFQQQARQQDIQNFQQLLPFLFAGLERGEVGQDEALRLMLSALGGGIQPGQTGAGALAGLQGAGQIAGQQQIG